MELVTNKRSKAGQGKHPWGLSPTMLARIQEARNDTQGQKKTYVDSLHQHTERFVRHARDLARSGQKDSARNWYRYFQNARVVEVIRGDDAVEPSSVDRLAKEIHDLGRECHPFDAADWETDIQAIRADLKKIVSLLTSKLTSKKRKKRVVRSAIAADATNRIVLTE